MDPTLVTFSNDEAWWEFEEALFGEGHICNDPMSAYVGYRPPCPACEERQIFGLKLECFECNGFQGVGVERKVVELGPVVNQRYDATQSYVLECGHTTIAF